MLFLKWAVITVLLMFFILLTVAAGAVWEEKQRGYYFGFGFFVGMIGSIFSAIIAANWVV